MSLLLWRRQSVSGPFFKCLAMESIHPDVRSFLLDQLLSILPILCDAQCYQQCTHNSDTSSMTISTVNENGPIEVSLTTGPFNSGFNIGRLRRSGVPRGNAAVGQASSEVLHTWELARAINDGRVARWHHLRRRWPATDIKTIVDFSVGRLSASESSEKREDANEVDVRTEDKEREEREGSISGFTEKDWKVDGRVRCDGD